MTHYTRTYKQGSRFEKRDRALLDCKEWLGGKRYRQIRGIIASEFSEQAGHWTSQNTRQKIRFLVMSLSLSGIQGYPAWVLVFDVLRHGEKG